MSRQCDTRTQYQFGCGISKMVGPKKQDFWQRINICTERKKKKVMSMNVKLSKIGHDFCNKVVQKLTKEKKCFKKKLSPKLIFFNEFFFF